MRHRWGGALALVATWLVGSSAQARCDEAFPIVGRSCRPFGAWDVDNDPVPRLSMRLTTGLHFSSLEGLSVSGTVSKTQSVSVPASLFRGLRTTSLSFGPTVTGFVAGPVYLGGGIHLGPSFLQGTPQSVDGSAVSTSTGFFLQGGAIVGVLVPWEAIHPFSFRGEVMLGGRTLNFSADVPAALLPEGASSASVNASASTWVIEPRIWVDLWKNPWMTFSLAAGKNLLRESDGVVLFALAGHIAPYDFASSWW